MGRGLLLKMGPGSGREDWDSNRARGRRKRRLRVGLGTRGRRRGEAGGVWRGRHAQANAQIVEAEGIRKRQTVAARLGSLGGVKHLVEHPRGDQQTKDEAFVGQADEHGKDEHVGQRFHELAVIHGAHPRNETEQAGQQGMSMQGVHAGPGQGAGGG